MFKIYVKKQYANKAIVMAAFRELAEAKEWKRKNNFNYGSFAQIWIAKTANGDVLG